DHADAGGGLRAGDQAEGQRLDADLPGAGHDLPLFGPDRDRLPDEHPARGPRSGLPVRDQYQAGDDPVISPARTPHREDGWVLVSAIVLMAIMLTVGLASF